MLATLLCGHAVVRPDMSSTQLISPGGQTLRRRAAGWTSPPLSTSFELDAQGSIVAFADLSAISWTPPSSVPTGGCLVFVRLIVDQETIGTQWVHDASCGADETPQTSLSMHAALTNVSMGTHEARVQYRVPADGVDARLPEAFHTDSNEGRLVIQSVEPELLTTKAWPGLDTGGAKFTDVAIDEYSEVAPLHTEANTHVQVPVVAGTTPPGPDAGWNEMGGAGGLSQMAMEVVIPSGASSALVLVDMGNYLLRNLALEARVILEGVTPATAALSVVALVPPPLLLHPPRRAALAVHVQLHHPPLARRAWTSSRPAAGCATRAPSSSRGALPAAPPRLQRRRRQARSACAR